MTKIIINIWILVEINGCNSYNVLRINFARVYIVTHNLLHNGTKLNKLIAK